MTSEIAVEISEEVGKKAEKFCQLWSFFVLYEKHSLRLLAKLEECQRNFTSFRVFRTKLSECTVYVDSCHVLERNKMKVILERNKSFSKTKENVFRVSILSKTSTGPIT